MTDKFISKPLYLEGEIKKLYTDLLNHGYGEAQAAVFIYRCLLVTDSIASDLRKETMEILIDKINERKDILHSMNQNLEETLKNCGVEKEDKDASHD
jgi:uncharacterized membrane protein YukC